MRDVAVQRLRAKADVDTGAPGCSAGPLRVSVGTRLRPRGTSSSSRTPGENPPLPLDSFLVSQRLMHVTLRGTDPHDLFPIRTQVVSAAPRPPSAPSGPGESSSRPSEGHSRLCRVPPLEPGARGSCGRLEGPGCPVGGREGAAAVELGARAATRPGSSAAGGKRRLSSVPQLRPPCNASGGAVQLVRPRCSLLPNMFPIVASLPRDREPRATEALRLHALRGSSSVCGPFAPSYIPPIASGSRSLGIRGVQNRGKQSQCLSSPQPSPSQSGAVTTYLHLPSLPPLVLFLAACSSALRAAVS